jgi:hypothetical protein
MRFGPETNVIAHHITTNNLKPYQLMCIMDLCIPTTKSFMMNYQFEQLHFINSVRSGQKLLYAYIRFVTTNFYVP